eukprot:TRINITY_DN58256_c0_g1_i1.p1 TRINITY_DN58256_c0_g1~~TRINITY_DN58256_c0_g1_i1.p1  ORF type:complete len:354 (-),score=45.58 TRINITY_DN58256_c0_g1_i1:146-1207(-)
MGSRSSRLGDASANTIARLGGRALNQQTKEQPIVYSPSYNVKFGGLENFHPFDSKKYERIIARLQKAGMITKQQYISPVRPPTNEDLALIHSSTYLNKLDTNADFLASVLEFPPAAWLPTWLRKRVLLDPMKLAVSGTIVSSWLATTYGWSINIGGGMHHASFDSGGGWCAFSDIMLAVNHLRQVKQEFKKALIIDLDAHQGNGLERDKLHTNDEDVFIFDLYNSARYPMDDRPKSAINVNLQVSDGIADEEYLDKVRVGLEESFNSFSADLVIYNAGTDILTGDPLGGMDVSPAGVIKRDEMVWEAALSRNIPIMMVLSGGYTKPLSANTVADSILNLEQKFNLTQRTKYEP